MLSLSQGTITLAMAASFGLGLGVLIGYKIGKHFEKQKKTFSNAAKPITDDVQVKDEVLFFPDSQTYAG